MDTEKQRQCSKADREWKCQKRAATRDACRVVNQQRMAARRVLVWTGTSKAQLEYQTCSNEMASYILYNIVIYY